MVHAQHHNIIYLSHGTCPTNQTHNNVPSYLIFFFSPFYSATSFSISISCTQCINCSAISSLASLSLFLRAYLKTTFDKEKKKFIRKKKRKKKRKTKEKRKCIVKEKDGYENSRAIWKEAKKGSKK